MTSSKLAAISSSVVVLVALVVGVYILGSPTEERFRRLDEQRIADLLQLSRAVNLNYESSKYLPENLEAIVDGSRISRLPKDPETEAMYPYELVESDSYRLCAEFSRDSGEARVDDFWSHSAGRQCFDFKAQTEE